MPRAFTESNLVIASHNEGKISEITELLKPYNIAVEGGTACNLSEPEENGDTFEANALIKARFFAENTGKPSLADDSGLVIPVLGGAPGIYSARWAGPEKDFTAAMQKVESALLESMTVADGYEAHFVCVLALCWPDGHTETFEGKVFGNLTFPPRGDKGFGYDPIFIPQGHQLTFAEIEPAKKHTISHRAQAFRKLIDACFAAEERTSAAS